MERKKITTNPESFKLPTISTKWLWGIVIIVALIVRSTYMNNGFVWLDHRDIELQNAIPEWTQLVSVFLRPFSATSFYRPVMSLSLKLDATFFNVWAPGYHLTNILLSLAVVVATVFFARRYFALTWKESLWVGLIAAVHPLTWLSTGAIAYRSELLLALGCFTSVALYVWSREKERKSWLVLSYFFTLVTFFAKETAVLIIPGLICVWEFTRSQVEAGSYLQVSAWQSLAKRTWRPMAGFAISVGFYLFLRQIAVPQGWTITPTSLNGFEAFGTRLHAVGKLFIQLWSPFVPQLSDATPVVGLADPFAIVAIITCISAAALIYRTGVFSTVSRLMLCMGILILPALNIVPLPRFYSPHYAFLLIPGVGVATVLIWRYASGLLRSAPLKTLYWLAILWVVAAGWNTVSAGNRWSDDELVFKSEVEMDPHFMEGLSYLGDYYYQTLQPVEAELYYRQALADHSGRIVFGDPSYVRINLAGVLLRQEKYDEAESLLTSALAQSAADARPLIQYNLAAVAYAKGDYPKVIELLTQNQDQYDRAEPFLLLLRAYIQENQLDKAQATLERLSRYLTPEEMEQLTQVDSEK